MVDYFIFFTLLLILLLATLKEKDFFPFSRYPMFSREIRIESIKVIRLQLETMQGDLEWWSPSFYRYPEIIGRKLSDVEKLKKNINTEVFVILEQKKIIADVIRLIENEGISIKNYKAIHIVERSISTDCNIINKTLDVISLNPLSEKRHE